MELTLKRLLEQAEFTRYKGKGYDQAEVDDFLDRASAMAAKVEVQLTQAMARAKEAGPGPSAAEVEAEVERRVAERIAALPTPQPTDAAAAVPAGPSAEEAAEESRRTLLLAQRTADAAVREAREDAEKVLASAKERSEGMIADAEARAAAILHEVETEATRNRNEARERLAKEIGELESTREALRSDVTLLEVHVEEQRTQLSSTVAELQRLLDDPSGFRLAPVPTLNNPEIPDLSPEPEPEAPAPVDAEAEAPAAEAPEAAAPAAEAPVLRFDNEVDHEAPGTDLLNSGPPTAPVAAVDLGVGEPADAADDDDAFLAELRKAISDEEPLGPRGSGPAPKDLPDYDEGDKRGWRFGRRG